MSQHQEKGESSFRFDETGGAQDAEAALEALVDRWETQRRGGWTPTADELCAERPELKEELARRISRLEKVNRLLEAGGFEDAPEETLSYREVSLNQELDVLKYFDLGGMGVLCLARDRELKREVAVKFLKPSGDNPVNRERFLSEARVAARMTHPGILPVYGFGRSADGLPFYAMRHVTGSTFEQAIEDYHFGRRNRNCREQERVLRGLLGHYAFVAQTVAYAHECGALHCDLKPQNILLGAYGETYVIDWGLAVGVRPTRGKLEDFTEHRKISGMGTEGYSHPLQLTGGAEPNPTWDIYSLGAILHKLLTDRMPGVSAATDNSSVSGGRSRSKLSKSRAREPSIPAALKSICRHALGEGKASFNYRRAKDLADDVQRYLAGDMVTGHAETVTEKVLRWQRSYQGATRMAGGLLIMLFSVLIVGLFSLWHFTGATEQKTRDSLETAVRFAAQTVALEMSNRWQALNLAAQDSRLVEALSTSVHESVAVRNVLSNRLENHVNTFGEFRSASWFLCDREGDQVARYPPSRAPGLNYAHRDYFHGNGKDLDRIESGQPLPGNPPYIREPYHSIVYRSTSDGTLKVAYSVPVFLNPGSDERQFLGVIGMSVELGEFSFLQEASLEGHRLILVDLREDVLSGAAARGLILHHPDLRELIWDSKRKQQLYRVAGGMVARLRMLPMDGSSFHLKDYADPVSPAERGSLAAFAKVVVGDRLGPGRDSGWAVIVQEKR